MAERKLEFNDGKHIVEFDDETGEVYGVEDWHGNEAGHRMQLVADEHVADWMADRAEAMAERAKGAAIDAAQDGK